MFGLLLTQAQRHTQMHTHKPLWEVTKYREEEERRVEEDMRHVSCLFNVFHPCNTVWQTFSTVPPNQTCKSNYQSS